MNCTEKLNIKQRIKSLYLYNLDDLLTSEQLMFNFPKKNTVNYDTKERRGGCCSISRKT